MAGSMSVMGLGGGFLDADLLDEHRKLMESATIEPIVKNMQKNLDKQKSLLEVTTIIEKLKTATNKFTGLDAYSKRKGTVTGEGVTATIGAGVALQDIKIQVHQLAKTDVTQVNRRFENRDSVFSTTNTVFQFNHNGQDYKINIRAGQSVGDVAQAITDATDGQVMGIMMKTGGSQPYQLMVQSKESGENNRVYFGNTISSNTVKGGALKGDFSLTLKDASGNDQKLTINLDTSAGNTPQDNVDAIQKALETAIKGNSSLKDLYDKGDINVGITREGTGFVINDKRGHDVAIANGSLKVSDIGLSEHTSSIASDDFKGSTAVKAGLVQGKITIGDVSIDLGQVTNASNTAQQNLDAIVKHINDNTKNQVKAEAKDGALVVNNLTNSGAGVQIILDANNTNDQNSAIASQLGITGGSHTSFQNFIKDVGLTSIQTAQDAKFSWNDIEVSRPSNTIDDVLSGVNIELTKAHEGSSYSMVRVTSDDEDIFKDIDEFVEAYNELMVKLAEVTKSDKDISLAGIFNGESTIRDIQSSLKSILNFSSGTQNVSISTFGFTLDDDGKLSVDKEKLKNIYKDKREEAIAFFRGGEVVLGGTEVQVGADKWERMGGTKVEIKGLFVQFKEAVDGLISGEKSTLKSYEKSLKDDYQRSNEEKARQQEMVDKRINGLKEKFNAYDAIMAKMNNQMSSLQKMMNASEK